MQLIFRFAVGGLIVSLFASFDDVVKPKSFAGLFAAAPSVALATLGLTVVTDGKLYAAAEGRSMIAGAIALFLYATVAMRLIIKYRLYAGLAATTLRTSSAGQFHFSEISGLRTSRNYPLRTTRAFVR